MYKHNHTHTPPHSHTCIVIFDRRNCPVTSPKRLAGAASHSAQHSSILLSSPAQLSSVRNSCPTLPSTDPMNKLCQSHVLSAPHVQKKHSWCCWHAAVWFVCLQPTSRCCCWHCCCCYLWDVPALQETPANHSSYLPHGNHPCFSCCCWSTGLSPSLIL